MGRYFDALKALIKDTNNTVSIVNFDWLAGVIA